MSRELIFAQLHAEQGLPDPGLPEVVELAAFGMAIEELQTAFAASLQWVGGELLLADDLDAARSLIVKLLPEGGAGYSIVPGLQGEGLAVPPQAETPAGYETALLVAGGEFGVAENAAVWVSRDANASRAHLFLTEHLVLIVKRAELVPTMHQAYARITIGAAPYGLFISGPSKTADIEQSLVIGAQGPRRMTVILVG